MIILAHRGFWEKPEEKNSMPALKGALANGYGIETDIRDYSGELVISHDIAVEGLNGMKELFEYYNSIHCSAPLALNIKADGLQQLLHDILSQYKIDNFFLFDMSVPEMYLYRKQGFNYFTRYSDIEEKCVLYDEADGIWVDCFSETPELSIERISQWINDGKRIGIISPEIHGRDSRVFWDFLKQVPDITSDRIMLCTDKPKEARNYFG